MVWDPPKQPVNIKRMIIYSFIPILNFYAAWRIQKFWVLLFVFLVFEIGMEFKPFWSPSYPYDIILALGLSFVVTVYFVNHFGKKYNEKAKIPDFSY